MLQLRFVCCSRAHLRSMALKQRSTRWRDLKSTRCACNCSACSDGNGVNGVHTAKSARRPQPNAFLPPRRRHRATCAPAAAARRRRPSSEVWRSPSRLLVPRATAAPLAACTCTLPSPLAVVLRVAGRPRDAGMSSGSFTEPL